MNVKASQAARRKATKKHCIPVHVTVSFELKVGDLESLLQEQDHRGSCLVSAGGGGGGDSLLHKQAIPTFQHPERCQSTAARGPGRAR